MPRALMRVEQAIHDLRNGKMIILTDHPDREDEGDLIFPAETMTPEIMNFIIRNSSGIVCLAISEAQSKKLHLPLMVPPADNTSRCQTPFTISIDAREGVSSGVSAADRTHTVRVAMDDAITAEDFVRPGHIFPLLAREGGVLERAGHTEGALDLVRLAGFKTGAVLCEVMNPDGTMARGKELHAFSVSHQITLLSIDDVINYRLRHENLIEENATAMLPLAEYGQFKITVVKEKFTAKEHVVLQKNKLHATQPTLVRIHSCCLTGDLFGSKRCDCQQQLHFSLQKISEEGGLLIYLNQEGRGIGLLNKIKAYDLQEHGLDTVDANQKLGWAPDERKYYIAAQILRDLGISNIRLLTNNPHKINDLKKYGINDIQREPIIIPANPHNENYLLTKQKKLQHSTQ